MPPAPPKNPKPHESVACHGVPFGLPLDYSIPFPPGRFCGIIDRMKDTAKPAKTPETRLDPPAEVLIIDNDQSHAETVAESLERIGCRCQVAASGTKGAEAIRQAAFDVILTDLVMSDIDGFGILDLAKSEQPDAEVILITGHGTIPSAVEAMQRGAFNYLLKPIDIAQLRATTQRAAESAGCGARIWNCTAGWTRSLVSREWWATAR